VIANGAVEVQLLEAAGELDLASVAILQRALASLRERGGVRLLLDLHRLAFIDSTGLTALYQASSASERLALVVQPDSQVARTLAICGFDQVLPTFSARAEALESLAR
jgi:anti-anti-sigma factor